MESSENGVRAVFDGNDDHVDLDDHDDGDDDDFCEGLLAWVQLL